MPTPTPASNTQQPSASVSQSHTRHGRYRRPSCGGALICLIGFFVWKQVAELNARALGLERGGRPRAACDAGRARGFVGGDDAPSTYPPNTAEFHAAQDDPYAVPPLPHMHPGLGGAVPRPPQRAVGRDPYRGSVPQTFNEGVHGALPADWGGEAITMTQMGRASPSPGPGVMYTKDGRTGSPAPGMYTDARTTSPGPQAAYGGMSALPAQRSRGCLECKRTLQRHIRAVKNGACTPCSFLTPQMLCIPFALRIASRIHAPSTHLLVLGGYRHAHAAFDHRSCAEMAGRIGWRENVVLRCCTV
ncbi:hypothetical protein B0H14DRAFT_3132920 [Mycena olivaceomarginata]|nr:hypothetical protein B0H14DRAFT_3132920 [Mycena olivaceomarginata]